MKWVKVVTPFHVASSGVDYREGDVVEVSEALAARHGKDGTGFLQEAKKPKAVPTQKED